MQYIQFLTLSIFVTLFVPWLILLSEKDIIELLCDVIYERAIFIFLSTDSISPNRSYRIRRCHGWNTTDCRQLRLHEKTSRNSLLCSHLCFLGHVSRFIKYLISGFQRGLVCGQNFHPYFWVFFFQSVYCVVLRYNEREFLSIINF